MPYELSKEGAGEWAKEFCKKMNESEVFREEGKGWGVGWNGNILFEFIGDESYGEGERFFAFARLMDGKCNGIKIASEDEADAGVKISGSYSTWKEVIKGELDPVQAMITGELELDGDLSRVMAHIKAAKAMVGAASSVETTFPDEK